MKRLVVTADDFGAAREVNEAVEIAHRDGILTATSLMVAAPAACDAVKLAKRVPGLRVGLHIVLVEGRPILPPSQIPDLVDGAGIFRTDMAVNGARMFFFPKVRRQLEYEIEAQFEAFRATGLTLDHVNAHKHFHLHPTIASAILRIGKKFGMRALRVPREPRRVVENAEVALTLPLREGRQIRSEAENFRGGVQLANTDDPAPKFASQISNLPQGEGKAMFSPMFNSASLVAPFASLLINRVRRQGIVAPDHVFGLRWSGEMTRDRMCALIDDLPEGLTEIYLHPATGPYPGSARGYRYAEELVALTAPEVVAAARDPHIKTGGFADFR